MKKVLLATLFLIVLGGFFCCPARAFFGVFNKIRTEAPRTLFFYNFHTRESLDVIYRQGGKISTAALGQINHLLRDYRTGDVHVVDLRLLDTLYDLKIALAAHHPGLPIQFEVISGYRTPATNFLLRKLGGAQAEKSQHMEGKAIDINVPGIALTELRDRAWCLHRGGIGFYPADHFVHIDTARPRFWGWDPRVDHPRCHDSYYTNN